MKLTDRSLPIISFNLKNFQTLIWTPELQGEYTSKLAGGVIETDILMCFIVRTICNLNRPVNRPTVHFFFDLESSIRF